MNTVLTNNYKLVKSGIAIAIATLATVILVVLLSSHTVAADTSLEPGDIAIIGFNFDNPDEYAFVLLVDIKAGASITFTDNGWYSAGGFRGGEGAETWTANTALSAGTVVTKSTTGMNLSADGDQILAYQGSNGNPTFVYALNSESVGWQTDATSSNTSALPTGLINGETAIALDEIDNAIYDAGNGTSGARAELLALVGDKANWTGHNSDTQTMPSGPFSVTLHALSISKAVTPTTGIDYYSNVTYTVVLGNSTALSDTHVLFTDTLPAEVDFARWIDQPPGAIENNGAITWTGTITDGESISFSFIVTHSGHYGDVVVNTAEFSGTSSAGSDDAVFTVEPGTITGIVINEIMQNPLAVLDDNGEWIELYNAGVQTVNIDGCTLKDDDTNLHVINNGGPLTIPPGAYLVLGNDGNPTTNGGVTVAYTYTSFYLANGDDEIILICDSTEIDRVNYDGGPNFPNPTGASMQLANPAIDNNVGSNWREAETAWPGSAGDFGTPGAANYGPSELSIAKTTDLVANVAYHAQVTYTIILSNVGSTGENSALLTDTLPISVTFDRWIISPTNTSLVDGEITWAGSVTTGQIITFTFVVSHSGDYGETVNNVAWVSGDNSTDSDSAAFTVVSATPDLSLVKTADPDTDAPYHGLVTYTLTLANGGVLDAAGAVITDDLPSDVSFDHWVQQSGASESNGYITWTGTVTGVDSVSVIFAVTNTAIYEANVTNTAYYSHTGGSGSDSVTFTVESEPFSSDIIINELDADTAGTDTQEFIELYDGGAGNTSLDSLVLVLYNGGDNVSYSAFDLDGYSTDANGYFVIGSVTEADLVISPGSTGWLQNGADAAAIYHADGTDFLQGTAVTTGDLIDAIVYDTGDPDDAELLVLLNASQPQVNEAGAGDKDNHSNQRCPNGTGGARNTGAYAQFLPSPGADNLCAVPLRADLELDKTVAPTSNPGEGDTITYTLELANDAASTISATNVVVVDYMPDVSIEIVYVDNSCGATVAGDIMTWTVTSLLTDTAVTCDVVVVIRAGTGGGSFANYAEVFASDQDDSDSTPGNLNPAEDDEAVVTVFVDTPAICGTAATLIHVIQGSGDVSPENGNTHTIEAVVVGDYQDIAGGLSGFFVQEEDDDADTDPTTSEGMFVYDDGFGVDVVAGDLVRVTGEVVEYRNLTELGSVSDVTLCGAGNSVAAALITLPIADTGDWEHVEGMLVNIPQELHVTENYGLGRYGQVHLSINDHVYNPTNVTTPGAAANTMQDLNDRSRVILDDANPNQNPDPIIYPDPGLSALNTLRGNCTLPSLTGVMEQYDDEYRVQPVGSINFVAANPRPLAPDPVGGRITVASFNVLNYFNGDGTGGGFPTPRGASSLSEFNRQRTKIISAILTVDASVTGLMEMENDGYGANSAIRDLVDGLNAIAGAGTYTFTDPGVTQIGTDEIAVGLIYRPGAVTPAGSAAILDSSVDPAFDDTKNRPALAQTFEENATTERFTVVVNHFKSKGCGGSSGANADQGDGQGCWNAVRTDAATALTAWLASDPTGSGDPDYIVIGDLNSYAMEDPIVAIEGAGYADLLEQFVGPDAYSYVFGGQAGYLDYAMSNASLTPQVSGATAWHINADEPIILDYNEEFKSPGHVASLYDDGPYRASDHDPVIVGLHLGEQPALAVSKRVEPTAGVALGGIVTYTIVIRNDGTAAAAGVVVTDELPPGVDFDGWLDKGSAQLPPPFGDTVAWGPWPVAAGDSYTLSFTAIVTPPATYEDTITNTAKFVSANAGNGSSNDAVFTIESEPPAPSLAIAKTAASTTDVAYHGVVTYTIAIANSGNAAAGGVLVTDTLPVGVTFGSWIEQPSGAVESDDEIAWSGDVAASDAVTFTFTVTHTGGPGDIVTNTAEYSHASGSDSDSATFVLARQPVSPSYTLTVDVVGKGSVTLDPAGGTYTEGIEITLIPVPAVSWQFDKWSGGLTGSDDPATVTMDANVAATATFIEKPQPVSDMSDSLKLVNLINVTGGDCLTYTIRLFNISDTIATASLTDSIPNGATYVENSVWASSGAASFGAGQVSWSGGVVSGTPVIIQFAAMVNGGLDVGTIIENTAYLNDGAGHTLELTARSIVNPGFWLSIDDGAQSLKIGHSDGALYVNQDVVTLTYSYATGKGISQVQFSNDGGFGAGSSNWESIVPGSLVRAGWQLDIYGNLVMPRTVYARFRDADSGLLYGPVQDDVIYDSSAPTVSSIEILTQATFWSNGVGGAARDTVTLRVTTSDDNSGVDKIVVSHDGVCDANDDEFGVTQATQDLPWALQSSGEVYVCAVDRAGNTSPARFEQGEAKHIIFLPFVVRGG